MFNDIYKTYYWKEIEVSGDYTVGNTKLLNNNDEPVGDLMLIYTASGNNPNEKVYNINFTFAFDEGSMICISGYNTNTFNNIQAGTYGITGNRTGMYANYNFIEYFFEYDYIKGLWKITFKFNNK
jgi:hypothetical protein